MSDVNDPTDLANNRELVADLSRFAEGVLTEQQVRRKWRHLDQSVWDAPDDALVDAVEAERVRRIRTGTNVREKAQLLHTRAPDILSEIMTGDASPRHKIESARALGQIATPVANPAPAADASRFVIQINLGADVPPLIFNKALALGPEPDDINSAPQELLLTNKQEDDSNNIDDAELPTPWGLMIAANKQGNDGNGGQPI
jgi:hypothetical protein